jgi:hypothetical protein
VSRIAFPQLNKTELRIGPGNYALGLSTNEGVRFQGFHGRLLIVVDEAPGVKADIWEAVEYYLAKHLQGLGFPVRPVNVGERSSDHERYANLKAEL